MIDSGFPGHVGNRYRIIPGNNFDLHALFGKVGKGLRRGLADRIGQKQKSQRPDAVGERFAVHCSIVGSEGQHPGPGLSLIHI